jgi:hypothetical protein
MFDANSLCTLMQETGFLNVCEPEPIDFLYHDSIFIQSWMASKGIDPNNTPWSIVPKSITASSNRAYADDATLKFKPEIVTLVGVKPP